MQTTLPNLETLTGDWSQLTGDWSQERLDALLDLFLTDNDAVGAPGVAPAEAISGEASTAAAEPAAVQAAAAAAADEQHQARAFGASASSNCRYYAACAALWAFSVVAWTISLVQRSCSFAISLTALPKAALQMTQLKKMHAEELQGASACAKKEQEAQSRQHASEPQDQVDDVPLRAHHKVAKWSRRAERVAYAEPEAHAGPEAQAEPEADAGPEAHTEPKAEAEPMCIGYDGARAEAREKALQEETAATDGEAQLDETPRTCDYAVSGPEDADVLDASKDAHTFIEAPCDEAVISWESSSVLCESSRKCELNCSVSRGSVPLVLFRGKSVAAHRAFGAIEDPLIKLAAWRAEQLALAKKNGLPDGWSAIDTVVSVIPQKQTKKRLKVAFILSPDGKVFKLLRDAKAYVGKAADAS
ncbi:hypothetical protein M885DRAFT_552408 [Pelagophyceae sp. CCMP2097]|nr:hypothetical protein M885DRAFT_552408 [Pelagophyceae sp. CCMP2097]